MKKKKIYTVVMGILLLALYITIFCFSAEDGESSSAISERVTGLLYRIYYAFMGSGQTTPKEQVVIMTEFSSLEGFVRKLAHFTEYMGVGLLSYGIVVMWYEPVLKGWLLVLLQLFLSASADELHQYFVPGRNAAFKDVLIDTAGGITGMVLVFLLVRIGKRKKITSDR